MPRQPLRTSSRVSRRTALGGVGGAADRAQSQRGRCAAAQEATPDAMANHSIVGAWNAIIPGGPSDDESGDAWLRVLRECANRRGVLVTVAGLAGLHLSEALAQRRHRDSRKRRGQATGPHSAESQPQTVTIATDRFRDAPGDFTATGAVEDSGEFTVEVQHFGGIGAPTFLIIDAIYSFAGALGAFTMRVRIKDTFNPDDPALLTAEGTWVVLSGTGAYDRLHARGTLTGTLDEHAEPAHFLRTFTGAAHYA
jgi:hypothetical protein